MSISARGHGGFGRYFGLFDPLVATQHFVDIIGGKVGRYMRFLFSRSAEPEIGIGAAQIGSRKIAAVVSHRQVWGSWSSYRHSWYRLFQSLPACIRHLAIDILRLKTKGGKINLLP